MASRYTQTYKNKSKSSKKKRLDYYQELHKQQQKALQHVKSRLKLSKFSENQSLNTFDNSLNGLLKYSSYNRSKSQREGILNFQSFIIDWKNPKGYICKKQITLQSKCFCTHPLKYHQAKQPKFKHSYEQQQQPRAYCTVIGCICDRFQYVPAYGIHDFICICKHFYKDHDPRSKKCKKQRCISCSQFSTGWTCDCGFRFNQHQTILSLKKNQKNSNQIFNITNKGNQFRSISQQKELFTSRMNEYSLKQQQQLIKALQLQQKRKQYLKRANEKFQQNGTFALQYALSNSMFPFQERANKIHSSIQKNKITPYQLSLQKHNYQMIKISQIPTIKKFIKQLR